MNNLKELIRNKDFYVQEKEKYLDGLKTKLIDSSGNFRWKYNLQKQLYQAYAAYKSDSAIYYAKQNVALASEFNVPFLLAESQLDLASFYLIGGMYVDTEEILVKVRKDAFDNNLASRYYDIKKNFYKFYAFNHPNEDRYLKLSYTYRDSLLAFLDKASNHYKMVYAEKLIDLHKNDRAKDIIQKLLEEQKEDTHEKAMLAHSLAKIYQTEGNLKKERAYLILSASCDIKNAIKENASMQVLATLLYQVGDINDAYTCIKSSMDDALSSNARFRSYEASQVFPVIDSAYQNNQNQKRQMLILFLTIVSILSICLLVAIIYVYRQMQRVKRVQMKLFDLNEQLKLLNEKLHVANEELRSNNQEILDINKKLSDTNHIKEVYIGHFLDLCSTYIEKLEKFQNTIKKLILGNKINDLLKIVKSGNMVATELNELYDTFDNIFLQLFPNFIEEMNLLLEEDGRFEILPNEPLNTELRIFALIRLGVSNTAKIARFLHYSINTIYSYRARVRNRALVKKDEFDSYVMKIGSF